MVCKIFFICLNRLDEDMRPVKLNRVVIGYPVASEKSSYKFEITLSYRLMAIIGKYSDSKPTLVSQLIF